MMAHKKKGLISQQAENQAHDEAISTSRAQTWSREHEATTGETNNLSEPDRLSPVDLFFSRPPDQ